MDTKGPEAVETSVAGMSTGAAGTIDGAAGAMLPLTSRIPEAPVTLADGVAGEVVPRPPLQMVGSPPSSQNEVLSAGPRLERSYAGPLFQFSGYGSLSPLPPPLPIFGTMETCVPLGQQIFSDGKTWYHGKQRLRPPASALQIMAPLPESQNVESPSGSGMKRVVSPCSTVSSAGGKFQRLDSSSFLHGKEALP